MISIPSMLCDRFCSSRRWTANWVQAPGANPKSTMFFVLLVKILYLLSISWSLNAARDLNKLCRLLLEYVSLLTRSIYFRTFCLDLFRANISKLLQCRFLNLIDRLFMYNGNLDVIGWTVGVFFFCLLYIKSAMRIDNFVLKRIHNRNWNDICLAWWLITN